MSDKKSFDLSKMTVEEIERRKWERSEDLEKKDFCQKTKIMKRLC